MHPTAAVVLAAGKGTRMKSQTAKVLHQVFYQPMVAHVLDRIEELGLATTVVVGHQRDKVMACLSRRPLAFVVQEEQLGTGHAVLCARETLPPGTGTVLILCGDVPLIRRQTLAALLAHHHSHSMPLTVLTTRVVDPTNYGRILCDETGNFVAIVEEKDATAEQKHINEINAGIYCVDRTFLFEALGRVTTDNSQGEIYLTDIVFIARSLGHGVERFVCADPDEVLGVNSRFELAEAHRLLQHRRNLQLMAEGVTLLSPESIFVEPSVQVGPDTVLHPNVHLTGRTVVGCNCTVGPGSVLRDCRLADNAIVPPLTFCSGQDLSGSADPD